MRVSKPALSFCLMAVLGTAQAAEQEIVRWTDADGTTHFGDARSAPATATEVDVAPANSMIAPATAPVNNGSNGPVWTVIDKAPKQNKVGWRSKGQGPRNGFVSSPAN